MHWEVGLLGDDLGHRDAPSLSSNATEMACRDGFVLWKVWLRADDDAVTRELPEYCGNDTSMSHDGHQSTSATTR